MRVTHALGTVAVAAILVGCAAHRPLAPVASAGPTDAPEPLTPMVEPDAAPAPPAHAASTPAPPPVPEEPALREIFPHVRVNVATRTIEIDCEIPVVADESDLPPVFLETVLCIAGTKDHESLLSTRAEASHVHAALLLIGLEPGAPGSFEWEGDQIRPIPAKGGALSITLRSGSDTMATPSDWISNARDGTPFPAEITWVFAGSEFIPTEDGERYAADDAGPIIGLATFGIETIAPNLTFSHESGVHEPVWIARRGQTPPFGSAVVVTIRPAD